MAKTSLILTSTEQTTGKTLQKTITDVNPDASSEALLGFAQRLNALTTNVYGKTDRVDKLNVDTETSANLLTPTFTMTKTSYSLTTDASGDHILMGLTYNGDGALYVEGFYSSAGLKAFNYASSAEGGTIAFSKTTLTAGQTLKIGYAQGDTYKATDKIEITITD